MQDNDILSPGMAGRGVAQKEPLQSQSYVACTWTNNMSPKCVYLSTYMCVVACKGEECLISCVIE